MRAPDHLRTWAPYLPHQAWLREHGASHDDPEGALPARMELHGAGLRGARLEKAQLSYADFSRARLSDARLEGAALKGAQLEGADLTGTDLSGADLVGARLAYADLTGARLDGTILDPEAAVPECTDEQLRAAALEPRRVRGRDRVYGWRTRSSVQIGQTVYSPGRWHHAHALSVDQTTECHPGIYLGGTWLRTIYPAAILVRVWAFRSELVYVSERQGARARRVWVLRGSAA